MEELYSTYFDIIHSAFSKLHPTVLAIFICSLRFSICNWLTTKKARELYRVAVVTSNVEDNNAEDWKRKRTQTQIDNAVSDCDCSDGKHNTFSYLLTLNLMFRVSCLVIMFQTAGKLIEKVTQWLMIISSSAPVSSSEIDAPSIMNFDHARRNKCKT